MVYGIDALIVGPGIKTGIKIITENPREVGADRIVDAADDQHNGQGDQQCAQGTALRLLGIAGISVVLIAAIGIHSPFASFFSILAPS